MISGSNEQVQQEVEYTLLKPECHCWWISKMQSGREDNSEERYAIKLCFKLWKNATETCGMLQTAFRPSCMNRASVCEWYKRLKEATESVRDDERCVRSKEKSIDQSWLAKGLGLGLLCWVFKGVQEEISSEDVSTLQIRSDRISTRTMHQSTTPSLLQTIWPRWASRQFLSLPIGKTLLPVTFGYSLRQRLSLWDNWGDERACDEGHWHAHTRGLWWGLPEVVGTVQQVHCSRRRLLRRRLVFHVCTINKSAHTKKVWKLI